MNTANKANYRRSKSQENRDLTQLTSNKIGRRKNGTYLCEIGS